MIRLVAGTAGHIDHGKSALVKALTGVDPDRLKEEKARGITTDLGFARLALPEGIVSFVDVPGHERFVKNMLAGAHGVDLALLVVAADEGVKPQTAEHLAILDLLGVGELLIVVSKLDLADEARADAVADRVRRLAAGTPHARAPHLAVSARTGAGLDELRAFLAARLRARAGLTATAEGLFRLPVDRVFTIAGAGTVVTGTTAGGTVALGAELAVHPLAGPAGGARVRVRSIERHGESARVTAPRERTALNLAPLAGARIEALARGALLAPPGALAEAREFLVRLRLLPGAPPLKDLATVNLHHLAGEFTGRIRLLGDGRELAPAEGSWAQLWLDEARPLAAGDRLVLRRISPALTWGGAGVLGPDERRRRGAAPPAGPAGLFARDPAGAAVWLALLRAAIASPAALAAGANLSRAETAAALERLRAGGRAKPLGADWASPEALAVRERALLAALARLHDAEPVREGFPRDRLPAELLHEAHLTALTAAGTLRLTAEGLALPGRGPARDPAREARKRELLAAFERAGLEGPDPARLAAAPADRRLYEELLAEGAVVRVRHDFALAAAAERRLRDFLREHRRTGRPLAVADLKNALGLSRKWAVPLLEYCDMRHWTLRRGDAREVLPAVDG